jgi:hypothetical protein
MKEKRGWRSAGRACTFDPGRAARHPGSILPHLFLAEPITDKPQFHCLLQICNREMVY